MSHANRNIAYWLITVLLCLPFWLLEYVPLVDLPLHLARPHLILELLQGQGVGVYTLDLAPLPNLGMDLVMLGLLLIFELPIATGLGLSLIVILFAAGARSVSKAFVGERPIELLLPFLIYNSLFIYGFINFCLGLGIFLLAFAYWYRRRGYLTVANVVLLSIASLTCYLAHLSSYAFLVVAIVILLCKDYFTRQKMLDLKVIAPLVIPLAIFAAFLSGSGSTEGIQFASIKEKAVASLALITSYNNIYDAINLVIIVALGVLAWKLRSSYRTSEDGVILTLSFIFLYLGTPKVLFTSYGADARIIPLIGLFCLVSVTIDVKKSYGFLLLCALLAVYTVRALFIVSEWSTLSARLAEHMQVVRRLPVAARVMPLFLNESVYGTKHERPMEHVLSYGVIERDMVAASYIAKQGQQPVVYREQPYRVILDKPSDIDTVRWAIIDGKYDFVWAYKIDPTVQRVLDSRYAMTDSATGLRVYAVAKAQKP